MDSKQFQENLKSLSEMANERKRLEARIDEIKKESKALEPDMVDYMVDSGINKTKSPAGNTIFIKRNHYFRVPAGYRETAIRVLRVNGMEDMIDTKPNDSRLGAWIKEQSEDTINDPEIPDFLDGLVTASTVTTLQVRGLAD